MRDRIQIWGIFPNQGVFESLCTRLRFRSRQEDHENASRLAQGDPGENSLYEASPTLFSELRGMQSCLVEISLLHAT